MIPLSSTNTFGSLLRQLRKRAGMTQSDLAAALGYSFSFISALEQNRRQPDLQHVTEQFIPALALQDEPKLAAQLVELAALARGEKPPASFTIQHTRELVLSEEIEEASLFLPIPPTPLLGREVDIKQLCNRLHGHSGRLLTLVGPPGVGKTRLALAVAAEMQTIYEDGACFVSLAALSDPEMVANTLIAALHLHEGSSKPAQTILIDYLRRKEMLLVLDNFEQIIGAAPLVADLLTQCGRLRIIVTSRERLHLRAEQRYKVQPLDLASAVQLFVERAQAVEDNFSLTAENRISIEAICHKLDCLPLAIELSATHCELYTPQQLLENLQKQLLDLLADGASDLPPHQRSVRLMIQHSYASLASHEQLLFRTLGVFAGDFDLGALAHFSFQELELQRLLNKSLVAMMPSRQASETTYRFFLLETVRAYALELLSTQEHDSVCEQHADYFLELAEESARHMSEKDKIFWLDRLDADLANLRAAFYWLLAHTPAKAVALAGALKDFWSLRSHYDEGRQWLTRALAHPSPAALRARALLSAGQLANRQGEPSMGLALVQESIAIYRQLGETWKVADALRICGWVHDELHQSEEKIAAFEESLTLFRQLNDDVKVSALLVSLVYAYGPQRLGYAKACAYLQESIELLRAQSDMDTLLFALTMLGDVEIQFGFYQTAASLFAQSLTRARSAKLKHHIIWSLIRLGEIKCHLGEANSAIADLQEGLQLSLALNDKDAIMGAWRTLGDAQRRRGEQNSAVACYAEALNV